MLDYPGHTCSVLFTGKCNFDCKFCYNKPLLKMPNLDFDNVILPKLIERKELVNHVILSGGECTIEDEFNDIIDKLYANDFTIGIHSNGTRFDIIERNINKISFYGIDYKTGRNKYDAIINGKTDVDIIEKSIKYIVDNGKDYEIRTTMYPDYVDKDDCIEIANELKALGVNQYTIQQYINTDNIDFVKPYTKEYLSDIQNECNKIIKTTLKIRE